MAARTADTIRNALGVLQDEPDDEDAWSELRRALGFSAAEGVVDPGDLGAAELAKLLAAARQAHEMRREYEAVVALLDIEASLATGERRAELVAELAGVYDDVLLDDAGAQAAYLRVLALRPEDARAAEGIARSEAKRAKWKELAQRSFTEAKSAGDASFKSSLLVSAAEIAYRYARPELAAKEAKEQKAREEATQAAAVEEAPPKSRGKRGKKKAKAAEAPPPAPPAISKGRRELTDKVIGLLKEALTLDPKNRRALLLQERLLRAEGRWEELALLLSAFAAESAVKDEKLAALLRLGRVSLRKLGAPERAMEAYERALEVAPGQPEATRALVDHFTEHAMWDRLVSLYEGQLASGGVRPGDEAGVLLQIAMVSWRMRGRPEAAEPYFERLRKAEPTHPGVLGFFREWCAARGEQARLVQILSDAQRALPDGPERGLLAAEIGGLAEEGQNAQKAIEQWRTVLRAEPTSGAARDALKRLYRVTGAFNPLADLLRAELEQLAPDDVARVPVLREISALYRGSLKSDSALITVLSQLIALDGTDEAAVRELSGVYEALGRWRDLLTTQTRLAELLPHAAEKAELYRAIARRWLDQFSNVQNATEAYESLRQVEPADVEATSKLTELYAKRRSYPQLYELLRGQAERAEGAERRALWVEMARVAAERLDRGGDAVRLYKLALAEEPSDVAVLDALERQAERDKDFVTVAEALERRAELADDAATRLGALHKLGAVYAERLLDHAGALRIWRRVLELSPGHPKALRVLRDSYLALSDYDGLTALYAQASDWEGLAEVLSGAADRAADVALKVDLSFRAAAIFETELGAKERAFRSYERVLSVRPDDRRAAAALVPLYEAEEQWARLPSLYEVLLAHVDGTGDEARLAKRSLYQKLAAVTGHKLSDKVGAFRYAVKVFELLPTEPGAVRELEEWARAAGDWVGFGAALEARANAEGVEPEERRILRLKLADVSVSHAGKSDDAVAAYRELIVSNPDDEEAVSALDRLLRSSLERQDDLRWLLRLRADRALRDASRLAVLGEWALLEEDAFAAPERASVLYREVLRIDPQNLGALRALGRLLVARGDAEGAALVLEQLRDLEDGERRVAREIELARLYLGALKRPLEALSAARRAHELAPNDPGVIAALEELLPVSETRVKAAALLEQIYGATGAFEKQGDVLAVLLATAASKSDRLALHLRLSDAKQRLGDHVGAFEVIVRATADSPSELELWDRLSVLANKTHRTAQFVNAIAAVVPERGETGLPRAVEIDLAERAATLYDEMLGEIDRAMPYLERILDLDPTNERAFGRQKQILTTRERWQDLEALYERVLGVTDDATRRVDLLNEVAIVAEEITGDAPRAVRYYERILDLEPGHEQALYALEKLYASQESWDKLAELLQRRLSLAGSSDTSALKLRLGTLRMTRLADPTGALGLLEEVVSADSSVREARELVEQCLSLAGHPELRLRAAIILEGVYVEREEMRELVRVLEVRLEFVTDDAERRDLLRRVAELRDERLSDDRGAFEAYTRLLPLAPADVDARARYVEIAGRLGRLEDAASAMERAAASAESPQPRAELLAEVARIYEAGERRERAEVVYRQLLEVAPDDPAVALPASRALERIYAAAGRSRELAGALRVQVALEESGEVRAELHARLGTLEEMELGDDAAAIAAWRARLEEDTSDGLALAALDRLYERTGEHRALVEVLRARERHADGEERRALVVRAARTLAERLDEPGEAILAYRAALDDFGAERGVLDALVALYEKAEQWAELAETLETALGLATEDADRIAVLTRLGDLQRSRLSDVGAAIEAYRHALTLDPAAAAARAALERLLDDPEARQEVAQILRPLYEAEGEDGKLLRVLDIQLEGEAALQGRLDLYARAASAAEGPLADPARAFGYAARAVREAAGDPSLAEWVERAERLTARVEGYPEFVRLLCEVVPEVLDEEQQVTLALRIAELARAPLSDAALARQYFQRALEIRPDDARALLALEELYREANEPAALLEILKRRAELAPDDEARRALLYAEAQLCDDALHDRDRAAAVYEQILDLGLDAPAVTALERLYAAAGRWGDLVALHERELASDGTLAGRRADLHHALGRVHERELAELDRAFDEYAEALREELAHPPTLASLEHLMAQRDTAGRAAIILEPVYLAQLDGKKVMSAVEARLASSEDPDERRSLLRRLAKLHEEQEEDYRAALETTAKLLAEDLLDETTWAELERLARVANTEGRLAEIYASELSKVTADEPATARLAFRAGELFEAQGDASRALSLFRRAYAFSPEDEQAAFRAVDRVLERAARPEERVALYREALDYRTEVEERVATLHTIAALEEEQLSEDDAAIATHRAILDVDEADAAALDALARLYTRRERFRELSELHRRRAEQSALPEDEARWRLALARVLEERLSDLAGAVDELEAVLALVPPAAGQAPQAGSETWRAAVAALERVLSCPDAGLRGRAVDLLRPVYERGDDWGKLVELAKHRFTLASSPGEQVTVLRDTARLLEERGSDLDKAFDCLKEAFSLDPDDGDTREELDRVAVTTERWDDLADAYERGIAKIDGIGQRELLEALAKLHDKRRDDPRRALDAWDRLASADPSDPRPLDEMDQLATLVSDWATLVRVLAKRAALTNDDEASASLWRRIGEARRDMLDDPQGAIDAYERALELEPASAFTLDNLIPLHEDRNDAARLVDLYRRRVELCAEGDEELMHQLLLAAARCYEVGLNDRREAVALLGLALASRPEDGSVRERLTVLLEAEKMWPELLDNLRARAGAEAEPAKKSALTRRVGLLLAGELEDYPQALEAFQEVLAGGYDEEAARAVRAIAEEREELRREAAELLAPVLQAAGRHGERVEVLELLLRAEVDPAERAATLRAVAKVSEESLGDLSRAAAAVLRAVVELPADAELHADAERLAALLGRDGWERYADALSERAASTFDAQVIADLSVRLGRVAEAHLDDLPRAASAYARSAEQGGDTPEVLAALERVYGGLLDPRAVVDVLERRINLEAGAAEQADLYHRLASVQIGALHAPAEGLATLRLALERAPEHDRSRAAVEQLLTEHGLFDDAFDTLEGVYRTTGRGAELGRLYARKVERAEGVRGRTRARLELARVLEGEAHDAPAAQRAVEAAVLEDATDEAAVEELERLARETGGWDQATDVLARALDAADARRAGALGAGASVPPAGGGALWARLGRWRLDHAGDPRGAELAFTRALGHEPENIELVRALEQLTQATGRERDRVAVLLRLVRLEAEPARKRDVAYEARKLAEDVLSDPGLTEEVLRALLAENEGDRWALEELTRLREEAGDHAQVLELLLRRADGEEDGARARAMRVRAAEVAAGKLAQPERAIALYEQLLEQDSADAGAQERLRALYEEQGKHDRLASLLGALIDSASSSQARAALRVDLARLLLDKFGNARESADALRAVLDEEPDHEAAALALASNYEASGRFVELAELWGQLASRSRARGDASLELDRRVTLATVLETRVNDVVAAQRAYEEVLERSPAHRGALEATARLAEGRAEWERAASALLLLVDGASSDEAVAFALRLAWARERLGDDAGVEAALRRALDARPKDAEVRARLAQLYEKTKSWSELAALLVGDADIVRDEHPVEEPALAPSPKAPPAARASVPPGAPPITVPPPSFVSEQVRLLCRAAQMHLVERKQPEDAIPLLERATSLVPGSRDLLLLLTDAYTAAHRERDAATVLERIIASFGTRRTKELSPYHHRLGRALAALGDKELALVQLDLAFKVDPGAVEVLRDLGVMALEANDLERAQKTFRALLLQRLDATSAITKGEVFCYLGEVALKQEDKARAVQMLERALENEPSLLRAKTLLAGLKG